MFKTHDICSKWKIDTYLTVGIYLAIHYGITADLLCLHLPFWKVITRHRFSNPANVISLNNRMTTRKLNQIRHVSIHLNRRRRQIVGDDGHLYVRRWKWRRRRRRRRRWSWWRTRRRRRQWRGRGPLKLCPLNLAK